MRFHNHATSNVIFTKLTTARALASIGHNTPKHAKPSLRVKVQSDNTNKVIKRIDAIGSNTRIKFCKRNIVEIDTSCARFI